MTPVLRAVLIGVAGLSVVGPAIVVANAPAVRMRPRMPVQQPRRVVPAAELPPVEPMKFVDLAPEDARAFNESVPFSTLPNPAARPFQFAGPSDDLARATDCMAAGTLYEAGDDVVGERAVAQVVLNRLRHPAFPKTVCGVVFEGQDRATGCQFSFSCDGAITRWRPTEAAWTRAREVATAALAGSVFRPVGYATHYHTDWVVPYWQASLDKIVRVGSHLFFRWSGWWGTPPAFNRHVESGEPIIAQLATVSDAHKTGAAMAEADDALAEASTLLGFSPVAPAGDLTAAAATGGDPQTFLVRLDTRIPADGYRTQAERLCGDRSHCVVMGWTDPAAMGSVVQLTPQQMAAMSFSYLRDRAMGFEKALWNCTQFKRALPAECMKRQPTQRTDVATVTPTPTPAATPSAKSELGGVRRVPGRTQERDVTATTANDVFPGFHRGNVTILTPRGTSRATAP